MNFIYRHIQIPVVKIFQLSLKNCFLSVFLLFYINASAQQDYNDSILFTNHVFNEKIKTVQIYKEGWNLSYPIISLNSGEKLLFSFDLLGDQSETFYYTFIHCDKDWQKSDIFANDYMGGDLETPIDNYTNSFNTTVSYTHYELTFPDERTELRLSGNYILKIYLPGKPEEPAITQRFIITENAVKIDITTHRPQMTKDNNAFQQADFIVNYTGTPINDAFRNIYAFVLQNGRWDLCKKNLKPDFTGNNELKYNSLSDKNIFPGGNEFRYFDIKSIRYQSEFVKRIDYAAPYYNVYLQPSESREFKPYFYWKDFNGKYYIAFQEGRKAETESDYVNVFFTLSSDKEVAGGRMFVSGGLNNWVLDKNNEMEYNREKRQYECTMLLKQGWYNYEYVFLKNGGARGNAALFEGNHFETENDYTVLIYYRNPRERFDRVLGTATANTLNKISN